MNSSYTRYYPYDTILLYFKKFKEVYIPAEGSFDYLSGHTTYLVFSLHIKNHYEGFSIQSEIRFKLSSIVFLNIIEFLEISTCIFFTLINVPLEAQRIEPMVTHSWHRVCPVPSPTFCVESTFYTI